LYNKIYCKDLVTFRFNKLIRKELINNIIQYVYNNTINSIKKLLNQVKMERDPGSLPYNVPMEQTYNIDLMDDDGLSADDWRRAVNFSPVIYYNNYNSTNVYETPSNSTATIKID
jgi:hypothetical protein